MNSLLRSARHPTFTRSFSTSISRSEHFLNATPEVFNEKVLKGDDRVVLVDFFADWCGPCKMLTPVLKSVISPTTTLGGADLMTIDTDAHNEFAAQYKISSLPTVIAFRNGKIIGKFIGHRNENAVLDFMTSLPHSSEYTANETMGVAGLWGEIYAAGELVNLHKWGAEGVLGTNGSRRLGVDAIQWLFHVEQLNKDVEKYGINGGLRILMFRCLNYIRLGFLLVLVFDGNKKPSFKRGKSVRGRVSSQQKDLIELAKILGIESRIAPGEAEYELAQMCRDGMIDAVLTDDVDAVLIGAPCVIRNPSTSLSGRKAMFSKPKVTASSQSCPPSSEPQQSHEDKIPLGHFTMSYTPASMRKLGLDEDEMIMIAVTSGGDYSKGVDGVGIRLARALASAGLGKRLLEIVSRYPEYCLTPSIELERELEDWRMRAREVFTNKEYLDRSYTKAASKLLLPDYPNLQVLHYYTHPVISAPGELPPPKFDGCINLRELISYIPSKFQYSHDFTVRLARNRVWEAILIQEIRRSALKQRKEAAEAKGISSSLNIVMQPSTLPNNGVKMVQSVGDRKEKFEMKCYRVELNPDAFYPATCDFLPAVDEWPTNNRPINVDKLEDYDYDSEGTVIKRKTKEPEARDYRYWIAVDLIRLPGGPAAEAFADFMTRVIAAAKEEEKKVSRMATKQQEREERIRETAQRKVVEKMRKDEENEDKKAKKAREKQQSQGEKKRLSRKGTMDYSSEIEAAAVEAEVPVVKPKKRRVGFEKVKVVEEVEEKQPVKKRVTIRKKKVDYVDVDEEEEEEQQIQIDLPHPRRITPARQTLSFLSTKSSISPMSSTQSSKSSYCPSNSSPVVSNVASNGSRASGSGSTLSKRLDVELDIASRSNPKRHVVVLSSSSSQPDPILPSKRGVLEIDDSSEEDEGELTEVQRSGTKTISRGNSVIGQSPVKRRATVYIDLSDSD